MNVLLPNTLFVPVCRIASAPCHSICNPISSLAHENWNLIPHPKQTVIRPKRFEVMDWLDWLMVSSRRRKPCSHAVWRLMIDYDDFTTNRSAWLLTQMLSFIPAIKQRTLSPLCRYRCCSRSWNICFSATVSATVNGASDLWSCSGLSSKSNLHHFILMLITT